MLTTMLSSSIDATALFEGPSYLLRKLAQFGPIDHTQRQALLRCLAARTQTVERGVPLVEAGEAAGDVFVVLQGWACSIRPSRDGRSPIVAIHMPGDICDLGALMKRQVDCSIIALSNLKVAVLSRPAIARLTHENPHCAQALWWEFMCASAIRGQWTARVASGSARSRIANLICELAVRLYVVGLADDTGFDLPITQTDIGNSCGLTSEHTNRVFRELRANGIVQWERGRLTLVSWDLLQEAATFDPSYLHFRDLRPLDAQTPSVFANAASAQISSDR